MLYYIHSPRKELARGTYAVIRINSIASCADAQDPEITALASKLSNKKYLAVITEYNFMPKPQWEVRIVSQGLPTPDKDLGRHEGMCTPIFPTTEHPQGREPLRANKEFPWKNCYHHSLPGGTSLAVSSVSSEGASGIALPDEEVSRLFRTFLTDSYSRRAREPSSESVPQSIDKDNSISDPGEKNSARPASPSPAIPMAQPPTNSESHEISSLTRDPNEIYDDAELYEDFSDGTSIIESSLSHDSDCSDGNEAFIRDPFCIYPTMDVWLDLSVFDSQPIPSLEDFEAEAQEISNLYLKWKAKQEERAVLLQKQKETSRASRSSTPYPTFAPKTEKAAERTRLGKMASRVRRTVKSFKLMLRRLLPCGLQHTTNLKEAQNML